MTIRVTITNEDTRDGAVVSIKAITRSGMPVAGDLGHLLSSGESCEAHVHGDQKIVVEEVRQPQPEPEPEKPATHPPGPSNF